MIRTIATATTTTTTADYGTIMHYLDTTWYSKDAASNDGDVNQSYRTKRRAWYWGQLFGRARSREGSKGTDSRELAAISCTSANNRVSIWRLTEYNPIMSTFKERHSVIFCHDMFPTRFPALPTSCWPGGASPLLSAWERQANSWSGSRRRHAQLLPAGLDAFSSGLDRVPKSKILLQLWKDNIYIFIYNI